MLVVAKKPRINLKLEGQGIRKVITLIKKNFPDAVVTNNDDNESVPIKETDGWKEMSAKATPADALRCYRDNAELTLKELSKKTGIAIPHLSAMENDKRSIGKISAQKLGKALKCNYKRFL